MTASRLTGGLRGAYGKARRLKRKVRHWLRRMTHPPGGVSHGDLRRTAPISADWGFDRGLPVDRYYIETFLSRHADDIRGHTLEFLNNNYTSRFGGARVTRSDVLHHQPGNPHATLVADLSRENDLPDNAFDCIICTQTLPFIYDLRPAVACLHRILRPGGILLATVPGITRVSPEDMARSGDFWRFTTASVRELFREHFSETQLDITAYGNVLAASSFLYGIVTEELETGELDFHDENYPVLISVRAVKTGTAAHNA
ncbi:MAG TPA: methyltransferase domain-containing protein [Gammaproteobacteria bacterium]|nr:methyltransferase domain-containing protein [Gammaproteobacteria bacterium]